MERPGDDFKATHSITIAERDTTFGGQISRLQVAEVIGTAIARTELAENKVGCHTCHIPTTKYSHACSCSSGTLCADG